MSRRFEFVPTPISGKKMPSGRVKFDKAAAVKKIVRNLSASQAINKESSE